MRAHIQTKGGALEIAAGESGVVPGVVRVKLGFITVFLSPEEAFEIGLQATMAARIAKDAKAAESLAAELATLSNDRGAA